MLRRCDLNVDSDTLREHTALAHAIRSALLLLEFDDGRRLRVSHDPAFAAHALAVRVACRDGRLRRASRRRRVVAATRRAHRSRGPLSNRCPPASSPTSRSTPFGTPSRRGLHPEHVSDLLGDTPAGAESDPGRAVVQVEVTVDTRLAVSTLKFSGDNATMTDAVTAAQACRAAETLVGLR